MNKRQKICAIIALILALAFAGFSFKLATEVQGTIGYVTDETWYVSSARNILREVFGVQPSYVDSSGRHHYTVFFSSRLDLQDAEAGFGDFIKAEFEGDITIKYDKAVAVSIATLKELNYESVRKAFPGVSTIQSGFNYPDVFGAESYLNTEHPPLVKYVLGFTMLALGDQPIVWRTPGIILGALALLLTYFVVAKLLNNEVFALLVFLFAFTDPVFRAMSSVAMLDIYATFFVTLAAWLALRRSYFLSALSLGFATSSKFTGVFPLAALFLLMVLVRKSSAKKMVFYPFVVPFLTWLAFNSPLIIKWGFQGWTNELVSGLKWFVTSRPPGALTSAPWGWFVNESPFMLSSNPDVFASVNPAVYLAALAAIVLTIYLARRTNRDALTPTLWFVFSFLGYVLIYMLGNRTMYSFYVVTMSTMAYVLACIAAYYFINFVQERLEPRLVRPKKSRARTRSKRRAKFRTRGSKGHQASLF